METQPMLRGWTPTRIVITSIAVALIVLVGVKQLWRGHVDVMGIVVMLPLVATIAFTARDARRNKPDA